MIETVLFRTNQRKLQLASKAPGAQAWKLYLRGQNLKKKRKSPRGNRTTGITEHQQAEKRRKRSKLTIKDPFAEQLDVLSEFMPDLTDSDAKILALRMWCLINSSSGQSEQNVFSKYTHCEKMGSIMGSYG